MRTVLFTTGTFGWLRLLSWYTVKIVAGHTWHRHSIFVTSDWLYLGQGFSGGLCCCRFRWELLEWCKWQLCCYQAGLGCRRRPQWTLPTLVSNAVWWHVLHLLQFFAALPVKAAQEKCLASQGIAIAPRQCGGAPSSSWSRVLPHCHLRMGWHWGNCKGSKKTRPMLNTLVTSNSIAEHAALSFLTYHWIFSENGLFALQVCVYLQPHSPLHRACFRQTLGCWRIRFQTGFECAWESIIFTEILLSVTNSYYVLTLRCFHCWRCNFQKVICPLNASCTVWELNFGLISLV